MYVTNVCDQCRPCLTNLDWRRAADRLTRLTNVEVVMMKMMTKIRGILNREIKMISSIIRGEFIVVTYHDRLAGPIIRRMLIVLTNRQDQTKRSTVVFYKNRPIFVCTNSCLTNKVI
jgi:hypothetical protein